MTRKEHLEWAKRRALEYVDMGDLDEAFASMLSDLGKHEETRHHISTMMLGMSLKMSGLLDTAKQMRDFIEGFN